MYIVTTEVAPHVRVSKTLDRVALFSREPRERRRERRQLNKHAAKAARGFSALPRLVKPSSEVQVIDLQAFLATRAVVEPKEVSLASAQVVSFDKRQQLAEVLA